MPNFVIAANIYMIWHLSICNSAPRELELRIRKQISNLVHTTRFSNNLHSTGHEYSIRYYSYAKSASYLDIHLEIDSEVAANKEATEPRFPSG